MARAQVRIFLQPNTSPSKEKEPTPTHKGASTAPPSPSTKKSSPGPRTLRGNAIARDFWAAHCFGSRSRSWLPGSCPPAGKALRRPWAPRQPARRRLLAVCAAPPSYFFMWGGMLRRCARCLKPLQFFAEQSRKKGATPWTRTQKKTQDPSHNHGGAPWAPLHCMRKACRMCTRPHTGAALALARPVQRSTPAGRVYAFAKVCRASFVTWHATALALTQCP